MLSIGNIGRDWGEIVCVEDLVPKDHLLSKIDAAVDFTKIYEIVEDLYCKDNGRLSTDPVVLLKTVIILSTFFAYPAEVRKIIYTTNIIEGLNRQFRKITKNKPSFTSDDSLRRILYLASKNIVSHWTVICRNWDMVSNRLSIMFADRESA